MTLGRPPPTVVTESQWGEPRSDASGTSVHVAGSISLWPVLLPIMSGWRRGTQGRAGVASLFFIESWPWGDGLYFSSTGQSSSSGWRHLERFSMPLPPPPSDDLRPPPSYHRRGVAEGCRSEKRKVGQGGSGKPLCQVLAIEHQATLHILSAVVETTKDTDTIAGLQILCIINEPKAAAITYGLDKKSRSEYLIDVCFSRVIADIPGLT
ncbi:hypothetical protein EDB85DRAFT_1896229 [Lactarius pseudohatsudake]|nr:hypothetical protein EDB85DRAFT_1896229 [Lactarius pseudohatsudake]